MATPYMNLTLPTKGGDAGTWDTILNDALEAIDAHNHTTGNGRPIPSAGIGINADLTIAGYRLTNVDGVSMINRGALLSTGACEFFAFGGNAYFRSAGGLNVQITNGGALNMTTVGGIAGDYTSVSAEVAYSDAADSYTFKQQVGAGARQYARMGSADVRLYEYKAHPTAGPPTNFVGLASPTGLAASYTLTMPAALPGATSLALVAASGAVSATNTVPNLVTFSAGATMAAGQNITVSGAGEYKHGDKVRVIPPVGALVSSFTYGAGGYMVSTGGGSLALGIPMEENERIKSITFAVYGDSSADITSYTVDTYTPAGALSSIGSGSVTNPGPAWADTVVNVTDTTITAGMMVTILINVSAANIQIGAMRVTYDRP